MIEVDDPTGKVTYVKIMKVRYSEQGSSFLASQRYKRWWILLDRLRNYFWMGGVLIRRKTEKNILILSIVLLGFLIRLIYFSGDGLGDDVNQFLAFKNIYDGHFINSPYYHRFSYWLPQLIIWKLFGISEFTFILPVLLSSLGCIYLVYLISTRVFGENAGLIAALLMAVNPFEVLNATLISTDVNLSLYMLLSVFFFMRGQDSYGKWFFFLSALFVLLAFVNKPFGLFILPVLFLFILNKEGWRIKKLVSYFSFVISLSILFSILLLVCWLLAGDPLIYINIYGPGKEPFNAFKMDLAQLAIYPNQMFFKNEFGERLHGFHFYTVLVSLFFIRKHNVKIVLPVLAWFIILFSMINFVPHKVQDFTPYTAGRIFRYFVFVVPPSIIFISYFWSKLKDRRPVIFLFLFLPYLALSIYGCHDSTKVARTAFGETRTAIKYLLGLGDVDIYTDWYVISKIERLEFGGRYNTPRLHSWHSTETPEGWKKKFISVNEGYVLTGGPRLPYYGCYPCIPNLADFVVPDNWTLIMEFDREVYRPWKVEPFRVWLVSPSDDSSLSTQKMDPSPNKPEEKSGFGALDRTPIQSTLLSDSGAYEIYMKGMTHFDKGECPAAQSIYQEIFINAPASQVAESALYFYNICYFRQGNWRETINGFEHLVQKYPSSIWLAAAHYHMGYGYKQLNELDKAAEEFRLVLDRYPENKPLVDLSNEQLKGLPAPEEEGFLITIFKKLMRFLDKLVLSS